MGTGYWEIEMDVKSFMPVGIKLFQNTFSENLKQKFQEKVNNVSNEPFPKLSFQEHPTGYLFYLSSHVLGLNLENDNLRLKF